VGFLSFSVFGFTLSLAPTWIASLAGTDARPVIGALAALVLGSSAVSQLLFLRGRFVVPAGLAAMAAGVGLLPVAGAHGSLPLLIGCCVAAGLGQAWRSASSSTGSPFRSKRHATPRSSAPCT
jgi:hypothetical protein